MGPTSQTSPGWKIVRGIVVVLAVSVVVVLLMLWLIGTFHPKVNMAGQPPVVGRPVGSTEVVPVAAISVPVEETAVGSIQPVHRVEVASKILAKVAAIHVRAGQWVKKDEVLVQLDDNDLKARQRQVVAALQAAQAAADQAKIEYDRVKKLRDQNAASQIELDRITSDYRSAEAELQRAKQMLVEADAVLGYATVRSMIDGTVIDKKVESGDMVAPGQGLLTLYDPNRMQLVASVRESLTHRLKTGEEILVEVDALHLRCHGQVSEIVPEAATASRSFLVKVTGPCPAGVYPGMFGRLIIPLHNEDVLVIPRTAVRQIGQLRIVEVVQGDRLMRRAVQIGRTFGERVEVLSGLRAGEQVAVQGTTDERA